MSERPVAAVTGAHGCVGQALVRALLGRGWRVRTLVRRPGVKPLTGAGGHLEEEVGNLGDPAALARLCEGAGLVFHAAALVSDWATHRLFWEVNCEGTRRLLEAARGAGVSRFVHVSTADVFGFQASRPISESSPRTADRLPYPASKRDGERWAWRFADLGLAVTVVYPTWVFGPGDRHLLPEMVAALRAGRLPHIGRGTVPFEVTYSENLAAACLLVANEPGAAGEGYLVGDGYGVTLREFVDLLARVLGAPAPRLAVPAAAAWALAASLELVWTAAGARTRPPLTRYAIRALASGVRYDCRKIRALGYRPAVGLEVGLRRSLGLTARQEAVA